MKRSHHTRARRPMTAPDDEARTRVSPTYFSLRVHPLPHFRVGGKILVKRDDFDQWVTQFRRVTPSIDVGSIVDDVMRTIGHVRQK